MGSAKLVRLPSQAIHGIVELMECSRFEADDAEQEWTFECDSVDFIHLRNISINIADWGLLLSQAYK
jgi:hypothetical protein